jgi:hypothetical protein
MVTPSKSVTAMNRISAVARKRDEDDRCDDLGCSHRRDALFGTEASSDVPRRFESLHDREQPDELAELGARDRPFPIREFPFSIQCLHHVEHEKRDEHCGDRGEVERRRQ